MVDDDDTQPDSSATGVAQSYSLLQSCPAVRHHHYHLFLLANTIDMPNYQTKKQGRVQEQDKQRKQGLMMMLQTQKEAAIAAALAGMLALQSSYNWPCRLACAHLEQRQACMLRRIIS